ncbi:MAG: DUF481 domain-containing protein [Gemmatimonadota bacterium]|nr:DUF481 domain-containing protein [Gemmatimonadota bacterium]MDE3006698.1 DUF481 domain-containing protein [Gemmatimonadota bacterium]MDE3012711.1 DUF481 domain-containing protein [Gemmatimonadota bacterium]
MRASRPQFGRVNILILSAVLPLLPGFGTATVSAQVNVEVLRTDSLPLGRSGSVGGDFSIQTGNVDFVALDFRGRVYDVTPTQTRLIVGNGGLGFLDRSRFASNGLLHYRRSFTAISPYVEPEWFGQLNYDRAQRLAFRSVTGGGVRTAFAQGAWGQFGMGSSGIIEYERLALPDTAVHAKRTLEVRWSNFLTLRLVPTNALVITSTTYVQPAVTDFGDFRALENLRLSASVTETLALTVSFDLRYDSRPPDGLAALDTRLRTGVTYTY